MSWPKLWTPGSSGEIHFSTEISWSFDTQASWHGFAHLVFSFNNSYTHPKFHIAAGKWLEDYYFRLGKWVTCQGLWKTRGGWLRFGWIGQNPHCFSRCPVLWALSYNLPPLVVVVRAPLLQFEVPQIYAVFRGGTSKHPHNGCNKLLWLIIFLTKAMTPKIWRILLHFSLMPSLNAGYIHIPSDSQSPTALHPFIGKSSNHELHLRLMQWCSSCHPGMPGADISTFFRWIETLAKVARLFAKACEISESQWSGNKGQFQYQKSKQESIKIVENACKKYYHILPFWNTMTVYGCYLNKHRWTATLKSSLKCIR